MNIAYAYVINKQLHDTIIGKTIKYVIANQYPHTFVWFAMEPSQASQYSHILLPAMSKSKSLKLSVIFNPLIK